MEPGPAYAGEPQMKTVGEGRLKVDRLEFYLGIKDEGVRGRRRWKQRKTWR